MTLEDFMSHLRMKVHAARTWDGPPNGWVAEIRMRGPSEMLVTMDEGTMFAVRVEEVKP